jgi:hypothetical protein
MKRPDLPTILTLVAGVIVVVVMLMLAVTDFVSFLIFSILIAVITFVLYYFGFVTLELRPRELDITYNVDPFAAQEVVSAPAPTAVNEVFYVSDNKFTYEQAPMVCKAYNSELASYSQVEQAYISGAEWCGYGWTEGGIALFPTQQATWDKMQAEVDPQKRIKCGRPGVNGGYFDAKTKFGVNCYGVRPSKPTGTIPSTDPATDKLLAYLQKNLSSFVVQPFNSKMWSEKPMFNIEASQTSTPSASTVPGSTQPTTPQGTTASSASSPAVTSTQLSAPPSTTATTSASHAAGPVSQAPPSSSSTTASARPSVTTGTSPMGILTDTFNQLGSTASNFVSGI